MLEVIARYSSPRSTKNVDFHKFDLIDPRTNKVVGHASRPSISFLAENSKEMEKWIDWIDFEISHPLYGIKESGKGKIVGHGNGDDRDHQDVVYNFERIFSIRFHEV